MHQFDYRIGRIDLKPFVCKIYIIWPLVVIVLKKLAQHQEINGQHIFTVIAVVVICVSIFMPAPINNCAM